MTRAFRFIVLFGLILSLIACTQNVAQTTAPTQTPSPFPSATPSPTPLATSTVPTSVPTEVDCNFKMDQKKDDGQIDVQKSIAVFKAFPVNAVLVLDPKDLKDKEDIGDVSAILIPRLDRSNRYLPLYLFNTSDVRYQGYLNDVLKQAATLGFNGGGTPLTNENVTLVAVSRGKCERTIDVRHIAKLAVDTFRGDRGAQLLDGFSIEWNGENWAVHQ